MILTNYLAESQFGSEVFCFVVNLLKLFLVPNGYKILSLYCWDVLSAHEAYTWDELAAAIRQAYKDITSVYVLPKLINWSESIHPYVNDAATTPGIFFVAVFNPSHGKCADGTILFFFWQVFKASLTTDAFMFVRKLSLLKESQRRWELLNVSQTLPLQHGVTQLGSMVCLFSNTSDTCTAYSNFFSLFWVCRYFPPTNG